MLFLEGLSAIAVTGYMLAFIVALLILFKEGTGWFK